MMDTNVSTEKISSLMDAHIYPHPVSKLELIETHISWVILTGPFAYKIKKPVNFGFLDFSTLEKRKLYCEEEVRLNRRLAPDIYLEVVPISRRDDRLQLGNGEQVCEYAVKMKQFPQEAQLDRELAQGKLHIEHMDDIAHMLSHFHDGIAIAGKDNPLGDTRHVWHPVAENFQQIREHCPQNEIPEELEQLEQWSQENFHKLEPVFVQRKLDGFIRECHGDLHLRNLAWIDGKPVAFDCIEFNENLRWIDIMSEMAFLYMDLVDHDQPAMANRVLNTWLEDTGDYAGLAVFCFYLVYRAMVRAKVAAIRLDQHDLSPEERTSTHGEFNGYIRLAHTFSRTKKPFLMITHGMSGSGKSTLAQKLAEAMECIRIRSDVERKRLFGLKALDNASNEVGKGIYQADASQKTYDKLCQLADAILNAGYAVIVDATFQKTEQRLAFMQLAKKKQLPFMILECTASPDTLRERILQRSGDASDANLDVLEHQLQHWQELSAKEKQKAIIVDTENLPSIENLMENILARQKQP